MFKAPLILIVLATIVLSTGRRSFAQHGDDDQDARPRNWRQGGQTFANTRYEGDDDHSILQPGSSFGNTSAPSPETSVFNRLNQMQAEIDALKGGQPTDITNPTRGLVPGEKRSTDVPRIEDIKLTPNYPRVRLTGFFQADAGWYNQDSRNTAQLGNIQDVVGFRRTRLAAVGDVSESVGYMLEMDFSFPGRPSFMDVWGDIRKVPLLGTVRVGQWRMPFGMDELTSVRELQFIERFIGFAQAPFRQVGIGFHNQNEAETMTWELAAYKFPTDFFGDAQGDRGYGASGRITGLLYYDEECNRLIHVGADYSYIAPAAKGIRFANQAEFGGPFIVPQPNASAPPGSPQSLAGNLGAIPFAVDTGTVPVDYYQLFNVEAGAASGSWYAQSEARFAALSQLNGKNSVLPTFYAETGYFLTGEVRPYNKRAGVFSRVKPIRKWGEDGGWGALEAAFRYSYADFNGNGISGNRLNNLTWGMNWYLNQYAKFQFNYIHSMLNASLGVSDFDTYAMRFQLDF